MAATSCSPVGGKVTVNWHLPNSIVEVRHPAQEVFPRLREISAENKRGFERVRFWFDTRIPTYNWEYVPANGIVGPGTGEPVPIEGQQFLRVQFVESLAHTDEGAPSITSAPGRPLFGFDLLQDWVLAGDFEAQVDLGIGLRSAAPLEVRTVEGEDRGLKWVAFDFRA